MLYRIFSSLKTSVFVLLFMGLIFLVGTIFPQGGNIEVYIKAGGRYAALVDTMDLLDIFMSPLFIFTAGILFINLAVCLYDRLKLFLGIKRKPIDFENLKTHPNVITFNPTIPPLSKGVEGGFDMENKLKRIGFKIRKGVQDNESNKVKIFEKGLQYWWLSWFYHAGIILAIPGFFITALFAFEKDILLYPDKPTAISLFSMDTRWNKFLRDSGMHISEDSRKNEYILTLKEFRTEYYQGLSIDYPKNKLERLLLGIGIKKLESSSKDFSYMPKMWLTRLDVKKPDGGVLNAELWINKPFRTQGLTLYQMGYEQKIKLIANDETLDIEARAPFQVNGIKGKFAVSSLKLGALYKKDGATEKITPVTTVYYIPENKPSEMETLGELKLGGKLSAKGVDFEFRDYEEGSYLSYRKDPGVWLVGLACLFVFLGLFLRSLGAWYRIQYAVENGTVYMLISSRGILADKDRIINKIRK